MKKPGIKEQTSMVIMAMTHQGDAIREPRRGYTQVCVHSAPGVHYVAARFDIERESKATSIGANYGLYVKSPPTVSAPDPVDAYNRFITQPFLKTTIATAFGFEPIPAPWKQ